MDSVTVAYIFSQMRFNTEDGVYKREEPFKIEVVGIDQGVKFKLEKVTTKSAAAETRRKNSSSGKILQCYRKVDKEGLKSYVC